jgi:hypothetical protein
MLVAISVVDPDLTIFGWSDPNPKQNKSAFRRKGFTVNSILHQWTKFGDE